MDRHDVAHYGIAALLIAGLGALAQHVRTVEPSQWGIPAKAALTEALKGHDWTIYAAPGSGELPDALASAVTEGHARIEQDMLPHPGLWLSPKSPEGEKVAASLGAALGVDVKVGDFSQGEKAYGTPWQIGVGSPPGAKK